MSQQKVYWHWVGTSIRVYRDAALTQPIGFVQMNVQNQAMPRWELVLPGRAPEATDAGSWHRAIALLAERSRTIGRSTPIPVWRPSVGLR